MPRRGCRAGRRKQLRKLERAYATPGEFHPGIFSLLPALRTSHWDPSDPMDRRGPFQLPPPQDQGPTPSSSPGEQNNQHARITGIEVVRYYVRWMDEFVIVRRLSATINKCSR